MEIKILLVFLKNYSDFFQNPVTLQLLSMLLALLGILVAFVVYRLQKAEQRVFGATALAEEIKSNIKLIDEYIQHSDVGGNLTEGTYELNVPERTAYDQYLGFVCQNELHLAEQIRMLYLQFSACKVIIEMNHSFIADNLLILFNMDNGRDLLSKGVVTLNYSLKGLSKTINNTNNIKELIDKLKKLR